MSDTEPLYHPDINFHFQNSPEASPTIIPQALTELRNQRRQEDLLWIKFQQERLIQQIRESIPAEKPPSEIMDISSRSLYGLAYDGFIMNVTVSEWELGGGLSLTQSGLLKPIRSNGQTIEYKSDRNTPQDWDNARKIVLNDTFVKRHQEFGDALTKISPTKADKYPLDIYLDPNKAEDKSIIGWHQKPELEFQETEFGWQPVLDLSTPPGNEFLFTPTAIDFFTALEKSGLELSHYLQGELIHRSEKRYGNSYVTLGREIAKLVNNTSRDISKLFLVGEDSTEIWTKIDSLKIPDDPAAALLIKIIKQLHQSTSPSSDLPLSPEKVSFKAGTCKDLETYFSESVNKYTHYTLDVNGQRFLKEGSHHSDVNHMMINLEPIVFNGITLPPGNLFRDDYNGGFHYMRPTAFCFDPTYADQVFGEEYRQSINSWGHSIGIFDLFKK